MKKTFIKAILPVILALLLTACSEVSPAETTTQPASTTAPTASTTAPTTAPTSAPTETTEAPTEPKSQVLDPALWWREAQHPSYEDALAVPAAFRLSHTDQWLIPEEDSAVCYTLENYFPEGYFIASSAHQKAYPIPGSEALSADYTLPIAADMEYAYLISDSAVLKLDLLTGEIAATVSCGNVLGYAVMDYYMLYYADYTGETIDICRVYLPEMKRDLLDTLEAPAKVYWDQQLTRTDGTLCWSTVTPELAVLLDKEFQNPDSPYKTPVINGEKKDFSGKWSKEDFWDPWNLEFSGMFLFGVQEMSGIPMFTEYTYHLDNGSVTTRQGIIDGCFFGTGKPHDHYNPEVTTLPEHIAVNGQWQPAPGQEILGEISGSRDESVSFASYGYGAESPMLYLVRDGYYTLYADFTLTNEIIREDARYAITDDNRLVRISHDGALCNTLYTGKDTLRGIVFYENSVFFREGDLLVELDLSSNQYRVILEQEGLKNVSLINAQDKTLIGIIAYEGMAIKQLSYDPVTGAIAPVT